MPLCFCLVRVPCRVLRQMSADLLPNLLRQLLDAGELPVSAFAEAGWAPDALGLTVSGNKALAAGLRPLSASDIHDALNAESCTWLRDLRIYLSIDSTNTRMARLAQDESVGGRAWLAELQTAGRGRRGRSWVTPFARNIAMTLGFDLALKPANLGGLSLAVGLGISEYLTALGVQGAVVKWPNDVLVAGAKICGVLIEVVTPNGAPRRDLGRCSAIIGVGLNVDLAASVRAGIDQSVTDLREQAVSITRDQIAAGLISALVPVVRRFERAGFGNLCAAYDERHVYQGRYCAVHQGDADYQGRVLGVTDSGGLKLDTADGERVLTGGEATLRPDPAAGQRK